jgi:outer membrane immunogenic protein
MQRLIGSLGIIFAILISVCFSISVHAQDSKTDARLAALEKENAALRKEISVLRARKQSQRQAEARAENTASGAKASAAQNRNRDVAQDAYYKAPMAAPPRFSWTGCFAGGHGGGLWANKDWTGVALGGFGGHHIDSWIAGVQAGCDYQSGQLVIGVQGDYGWTDGSGRNVNPLLVTAGGAAIGDRSSMDSIASVTARIGYAADRTLYYVRGGLAWERDRYKMFVVPTGATLFSANETRAGYTVGGGVEYALNNFVSVFAEYNYYNFGNERLSFVDPAAAAVRLIDIKSNASVVKGGVVFRFGDAR